MKEFRLAMRDRCICIYALNNGQIMRILDQNTKKVRGRQRVDVPLFRCEAPWPATFGDAKEGFESSEWAGGAIRVVGQDCKKEYPTFPSHFDSGNPHAQQPKEFLPNESLSGSFIHFDFYTSHKSTNPTTTERLAGVLTGKVPTSKSKFVCSSQP